MPSSESCTCSVRTTSSMTSSSSSSAKRRDSAKRRSLMRLDRLVLENVRQYAGRHQLTFAKARDRNVTLVQGLNGAGKTHLLEGLRWCLYGLTSGEESRDIVAKGALAERSTGDEFESAASVFFDHGGRSYE